MCMNIEDMWDEIHSKMCEVIDLVSLETVIAILKIVIIICHG